MGASDAVAGTTRLTVIEKSIYVVGLHYQRHRNCTINKEFLDDFAQTANGATTAFTLFEVYRILSPNLDDVQSPELFAYFSQHI